MIAAWKKARTWLLGSLLTLLGFSSCEKPGPDMYGPPLAMYGPPMYGPLENACLTRSQADDPRQEEVTGPETPEVVSPEEE